MPRDAPVTIAVLPVRSSPAMSVRLDFAVLAQFLLGDGALLHLVRAVGQAKGAPVGVSHREREVVGDAATVVTLRSESVASGKSDSVSVDPGGRRNIKKKNT